MLKIAIVGTGAIAYVQAQALLELQDEVKIVALCNYTLPKALSFSQSLNLNVPIYTDYALMLSEIKLDIVTQ